MNANGPVTGRVVEPSEVAGAPEAGEEVMHGAGGQLMLVASAGGHWVELSEVIEAFENFDCHYVTTAKGVKLKDEDQQVTRVRDCSRSTPLSTLRAFVQLYLLIRKVNPDIVLSTGAAPGAVALIIAKLRGKRTVWIDSLANCEKLSLSGMLVRPFADIKLTQWEHLAEQHRDFRFLGRVV